MNKYKDWGRVGVIKTKNHNQQSGTFHVTKNNKGEGLVTEKILMRRIKEKCEYLINLGLTIEKVSIVNRVIMDTDETVVTPEELNLE